MAKRTNLKLMAVAIIVVLIGTGSAWAFSGEGFGTETDPYVITDVYQLQEMQDDLSACYVLGNDIDASDTVSWNGGEGFEPVGGDVTPFTGIFDGLGHTITGLYIYRPSVGTVGLFGYIENAEIKNIGLVDADVTALGGAGTLVGGSQYSTIFKAWATGHLKGTHSIQSPIGGLVGSSTYADSIVSQCYSSVTVQAISSGSPANRTAGLVGLNNRGSIIIDCYANGDVSGKYKVGGLVGDNTWPSYGGYVARCYSTGHVTGNGGGLIGYNYMGGITHDSYWDVQTSGKTSSKGGMGKTTTQMMQQATFVGWDFDDIWEIDEGQSYPYFREPRVLIGIEIVGPAEVAENSNTTYKATAYYDIGSTKDVTASADWLVEPNDIASIAAGLLSTEVIDLPEDITIIAEYGTEVAEKDVSILAICPSGSALQFDGHDDYIEISNEEVFDVPDKLTLSAWIRPNSFDSRIVSKWKSGNLAYVLYLMPGGNIEFAFSSNCSWNSGGNGPNAWRVESIQTVDSETWSHCAAVHDGSTIKVYVNGNETIRTSVSDTICTAGNENVKIGIDGDGYGPFNGLIDEVMIYNRALSADQIRTLMHTRPDTDEPNLVAYWDFDEGSGQVAGDLAGGNDGQLGSTPSADISDPNWVEPGAPIEICTAKGLVERNLLRVFDMKETILEILEDAIATEDATKEFLDELFKSGEIGDLNKGDVVKAKQKIHSAIQQEEQAETAVDQSLDKLDDALNTLGIE